MTAPTLINCTIRHEQWYTSPDSGDSGVDTDVVPLMGPVRFIPQLNRAALASQYAVQLGTITGYIDTDGQLKASKGGAVGVRLVANDPVLNLQSLPYKVEFSLTTAGGVPVPVAGTTFTVPATDTTVWLSSVLPVPGATGTGLTQGPTGATGPAGATGPPGGGSDSSSVTLRSLFKPMGEIISSAVLTTDTLNTSLPGDYTSSVTTRWDSAVFNYQGQSMVALGGVVTAGGINDSNGRETAPGVPYSSCVDVEFVHTGDKLDLKFSTIGSFDQTVYIEDGGVMKKAKFLPTGASYTGTMYRTLRFSESGTRRIRLILPGGSSYPFLGVVTESSAILRRSPDRPLMIVTGDSYVESATGYVGSALRSFFTQGICDQLIEATGFAVARCGQAGTGHFNDGNSGTSSTPVGATGTSPFFSADRKAKYTTYLGQKPVLFLMNGSLNDGSLSGGQSGMQTRLASEMDWITTTDAYCSIAVVGPQPLSSTYIPTTAHTTNRAGMLAAVAAKTMTNGAGVRFVDANNPTTPFWTGDGTEGTPDSSPQAKLVGLDNLHPNWFGARHYALSIINTIADMPISAARAIGAA